MARVPVRLIALASSVTFVTYVMALVIGLMLLAFTSIGADFLNHQGTLLLGAFLILIPTPFRINLLAGYLGLLAIYASCFAVALRSRGGFIENLRETMQGHLPHTPNWLVIMPLLASGLLVVVVMITVIEDSLGLPTGSLQGLERYQLLYALTYSPILEETMFRITPLGALVIARALPYWKVPLGGRISRIRLITWPLRMIILGLLLPDRAKTEAGLPNVNKSGLRGIHWSEWVLLAVTSILFGVAHILGGAGWETGKMLTAAFSGLLLGVAYLAYGAYASILLHWFFNFYFEAYALGSSLIGGLFVLIEAGVALLSFSVGLLGIAVALQLLIPRGPRMNTTPYMGPAIQSKQV